MGYLKLAAIGLASFVVVALVRATTGPSKLEGKREALALAAPTMGPTLVRGRSAALVQVIVYGTLSCRPCRETMRALNVSIPEGDPAVSLELRLLPAVDAEWRWANQAASEALASGAFDRFWRTILALPEPVGGADARRATRGPGPEAVIQEGAVAWHLAGNERLAEGLRIGSLPTVFVNGRRFDGAISAGRMRRILSDEEDQARRVSLRVHPGETIQQALLAEQGVVANPWPATLARLAGPGLLGAGVAPSCEPVNLTDPFVGGAR
jgi:protein-disulfide isomerase